MSMCPFATDPDKEDGPKGFTIEVWVKGTF